MPLRRSTAAAIGLGAVASLVGCGGGDERVVLFAASSLTDVADRWERDYEASTPGVDVVVTTAGSSSLVAQLVDGAPVDVLATADPATMDRALSEAEVAAEPVVLARNELVIAVERGNPLGIERLDDLVGDAVVVVAAPEVPAGAYAVAALDCAGVEIDPASYEQSVRSVAAKVSLGEADAGLVYRTDVDDGLEAVELPSRCRTSAEYPIVAVSDEAAAADFLAFVTGPAGDAALVDHGFVLP